MNRWRVHVRKTQWAEFTAGIGVGLGTALIIAALLGALNTL